MTMPVRAISLDLDDTLWPIWPTIDRAERVLADWLHVHAPVTAAKFDRAALRDLRVAVGQAHPELAHDLSALRRACLSLALEQAGDDPALAGPAFDIFFEARQQVVLYDDTLEALERMAARFPLVAVTNGNSDLARVGIAHLFEGCISARGVGVAKPDPRIFHAACELLAVPADQVLHVGDDWQLDVRAALDAGLQAAWIRRADHAARTMDTSDACPHQVFAELRSLASTLGC